MKKSARRETFKLRPFVSTSRACAHSVLPSDVRMPTGGSLSVAFSDIFLIFSSWHKISASLSCLLFATMSNTKNYWEMQIKKMFLDFPAVSIKCPPPTPTTHHDATFRQDKVKVTTAVSKNSRLGAKIWLLSCNELNAWLKEAFKVADSIGCNWLNCPYLHRDRLSHVADW